METAPSTIRNHKNVRKKMVLDTGLFIQEVARGPITPSPDPVWQLFYHQYFVADNSAFNYKP
jgi:hypothetical protein